MKFQRSSIWVVVALLLLLPSPAKADFIYTISFNALDSSIPADSFSFTVADIITSAQSIPMPAGTELNDFYLDSLDVSLVSTSLMFSVPTRSYGWGLGDLGGFSFVSDSLPTGVGTYPSTNNAIRVLMVPWVGFGFRQPTPYPSSGTLTITDVGATAVPEPASLLLLGTGLFGLGRAWRKRR